MQRPKLFVKEKLLKKKKHFLAAGSFLLTILILQVSYFYISGQETNTDYLKSNYKISGIAIPKDLNFAGEKVPVEEFTIRENFIEQILKNTYWQSHSLVIHKRAHKWFPVIERILKKNKIPDDFKYLAVVESNLTNSISPKGATGFWQIIEGTGIGYGLEINENIDERYNVEKSTEAACKYFKEAYKKFNNWTLVAASYNLGMGGINSKLKKQDADDYYDLLLNSETGEYLYKVLTVKEILSRPEAYGFKIKKRDLSGIASTYKIQVDSTINDLSLFAEKYQIKLNILIIFNPWIRANVLNNPEKKVYILTFPDVKYSGKKFTDDGFVYIEADTTKINPQIIDSLSSGLITNHVDTVTTK